MSMSLGKVLKENSLIEEELENFKKNMDQACAEAVKHVRLVATKEIRAEMSLKREREMKEFKAQFNVLVKENATLQQKLKDADISVAVASESQDRTKKEIRKLESARMTSQSETRKFPEEVCYRSWYRYRYLYRYLCRGFLSTSRLGGRLFRSEVTFYFGSFGK